MTIAAADEMNYLDPVIRVKHSCSPIGAANYLPVQFNGQPLEAQV